ncbi:MAG: peptidylprolyl isomerase [Spirochaetia bacterium]|nr:peptidylprolyl isomerase [Spirochaetia bacterium]
MMKELCMNSNPVVTIEMEDGGTVTVELYPETAPNTVNNFINLVSKGYYDGLIFHRVIPGFMIQAGCPQGAGTGGPGYTIKGEFSLNGFTNPLIHDRGVISMARTNNPDSAGSQFFIMTAKSDHLDGMYAAFGRVTSGMETVDKIVNMPKNSMDKPKEDQRMKKVTIDAKGLEYPEPQKV